MRNREKIAVKNKKNKWKRYERFNSQGQIRKNNEATVLRMSSACEEFRKENSLINTTQAITENL